MTKRNIICDLEIEEETWYSGAHHLIIFVGIEDYCAIFHYCYITIFSI